MGLWASFPVLWKSTGNATFQEEHGGLREGMEKKKCSDQKDVGVSSQGVTKQVVALV